MSDYEEHHFKAPPSDECGQRISTDAPRTMSPIPSVGTLIAQRISALRHEIQQLEDLRDHLPIAFLNSTGDRVAAIQPFGKR